MRELLLVGPFGAFPNQSGGWTSVVRVWYTAPVRLRETSSFQRAPEDSNLRPADPAARPRDRERQVALGVCCPS